MHRLDYQVIMEEVNFTNNPNWSSDSFENKVKQALLEGWELQGGISSVGLDAGTQMIVMQAMVRRNTI